ncbi:hypothetical protein [uncultured Eubacterium sp.]|uniref:hypothetical protein n=1 Tax=uncultured Eubacterium sp. TaxID=165185 RepID=UPI0025923313|nr:hypothetical protein [uncultured Eubacterium sp.]
MIIQETDSIGYGGENNYWKDYVGCDDFDEQVVLFGNRDFNGIAEASWYNKAKEILENIDYYDEYPEDLSTIDNAKLKELYENCDCIEDIIIDVLKILYPEDEFKEGMIQGYCQSDWENYIVKGNVDINLLEAYYFGKISDVWVEDFNDNGSYSSTITHDDLWEAERKGLEKFLRDRYDIPEDEELHIYIADGTIQVLDWKEVS